MADETTKRTEVLIDRLRERGHHGAAEHLARTLVHGAESGLLFALRETLETLLTGVEAIDPVTETMMEELRLEVEKRLGAPGGTASTPRD
jgi:hypothetical protein